MPFMDALKDFFSPWHTCHCHVMNSKKVVVLAFGRIHQNLGNKVLALIWRNLKNKKNVTTGNGMLKHQGIFAHVFLWKILLNNVVHQNCALWAVISNVKPPCVEMGFYVDICWETKCNSWSQIWCHLYQTISSQRDAWNQLKVS